MKFIVTLFLVLSVLSCSSTGNKDEKALYQSSSSSPSLEIPPDLTKLNDADNKSLPSSIVGTRAAISRYKDTGPLLERVLPKLTGILLQGEGDFYWLEIEQKPTLIYDLLKIFWAEEGFVLEQDEPLIGVMKTELLENKAGLLSNKDTFLSNIFSALSDSDKRDQYKTRVARSEIDGITKVFLTQYGTEFMLVEDKNLTGQVSGWQSRERDPELEVEMLSRMMIFLGLQDEEIKLQLAKIGQFPKRAKIIKDENDVTSLVLKESIDRGWNRVVFQLDQLGVEYISNDRDNNLIKVKQKTEQKETGFFASLFASDESKEEEKTAHFNIELDGTSGDTTIVNIVNDHGSIDDSDAAIALLQYLFEALK